MNKNIKPKLKYNYDYTKCMMMKISMAYPAKDQALSVVINDYEGVVDIIKKVDAVTKGITKIYYLVGWQYLGHDDKYPDFFEFNSALKRNCDKSAKESFLWAYKEAKKYNSVLSVHINFNDAYDNAPSFERFVKEKALIRQKNGKPHAIEKYNGRPCYKTSFKEYWTSGLFCEMFDRLLTVLPLEDAKTVHVDNFQCYRNYCPDITISEMQRYRRKMVEYVSLKGIDITSEFTYRENDKLPNKKIFGLPREHNRHSPIDTLGEIPVSWWITRLTRQEYVDIPPSVYGGGVYKDRFYKNYLYSNIHGEDVFGRYNKEKDWFKDFVYQYATVQLPYHFLCRYERQSIKGFSVNQRCIFNKNLISYNKGRKIVKDGYVIKDGDNLCLPQNNIGDTYIAYSKDGEKREWHLLRSGYKRASVYDVTENGENLLDETEVKNNAILLDIKPNQLLKIILKK